MVLILYTVCGFLVYVLCVAGDVREGYSSSTFSAWNLLVSVVWPLSLVLGTLTYIGERLGTKLREK